MKKLIPRNRATDALWLVRRFIIDLGYFPNLLSPKTFNEKILYRLLFDRRESLRVVANKLTVRDYISKTVGDKYLVKLLACVGAVRELHCDRLPNAFVVKASHGSGWVKIVQDKTQLNWQKLEEVSQSWLQVDFGHKVREWCYTGGPRKIMVEEFLSVCGQPPVDYKLFCFSGRVEFVQVDRDRFSRHTRNLYNRDWDPLPFAYGYPRGDKMEECPAEWGHMVEVAEKISCGWDFMRVDLYNVSGRVLIGELTNYPGAGRERFTPRSYDQIIGNYWQQKSGSNSLL